jgi:cellulose synthase/poly-beta-1,6-N-acetylglucosamine synthase-like glycosyltransferase
MAMRCWKSTRCTGWSGTGQRQPVGAVTGNPRIRNRSTLLGRLQVAEFSSIIGMIKRAQRVYGRIFTISGVIAGFRAPPCTRSAGGRMTW